MGDDSLTLKLIALLLIVSLIAILVAGYHCLTIGCSNRRRQNSAPPPNMHLQNQEPGYSIENSVVLLIPAHKHHKGSGLGGRGEEDDAICAICLCEFEEEEELRTLPECSHSFHVPCIDMWLHSHLTCPVCRADAAPSPHIFFQFLDSDSETEVREGDSNIMLSMSG